MSGSGLDHLVSLARRDGSAKLIHEKADFDWPRELILEALPTPRWDAFSALPEGAGEKTAHTSAKGKTVGPGFSYLLGKVVFRAPRGN
ncbi:MAG: hypothetical protein ACE5JI_06205 [Acidobacteriota bacterium]